MMSRQLNAVATSTLNQKQLRHQRAREKRSRHHQLKREGRDISQRLRQQLHRKEVATTPGCHDNNCTEQKVATTSSCRDIKYKEKRGRDKIKLSRHQLHLRHVATKQRLLRQRLRQQRSQQGLDVATVSTNWAS